MYPLEKEKDNVAIAMGNKRELAKIKYSEIKKKNIIRQDMSTSNAVRLPELRGVAANSNLNINQDRSAGYGEGNAGDQTSDKINNNSGKGGKNELSINLNLNFNVNFQIESTVREIRGRAATVPD